MHFTLLDWPMDVPGSWSVGLVCVIQRKQFYVHGIYLLGDIFHVGLELAVQEKRRQFMLLTSMLK